MRLAISRSAAPSLSLAQLSDLARRRGLDGVEIGARDLDGLSRAAPIAGVYVESADAAASEATARVAADAGVPVVAARGAVPTSAIPKLDELYARVGGALCVTHGTDAEEAAELVSSIAAAEASHVFTAWEVQPTKEDLGDSAAVLLVAGETLRYIRLRGGGPEHAAQDGAGVGELFSSVALAGYAGTIAMTPSAAEHVAAWERWLERSAKSGCGSARAEPADISLDMRPVEPRDRLETILGSYRALSPGRTLHLTLDHDPSCMYYTLEATEPSGSFAFNRLENGPEVWRVDVQKR